MSVAVTAGGRLRLAAVCTLALVGGLLVGPAPGRGAAPEPGEPAAEAGGGLEVYTGSLTAAQLAEVRAAGVDTGEAAGARGGAGGRTGVELVLSPVQARRLAGRGVPLSVKRVDGRSAAQQLRRQDATPTVFRPYLGADGLRADLLVTAAAHPSIAQVVTLGRSGRGTPIEALRVTRDVSRLSTGHRPAVLYIGAQHAREWITTEMVRRLSHYIVDRYRTDPTITRLVDTTELWFVPVANPDGYDFTFTEGNRLWRKNLRDNDGDGQITIGDGVDLNRNFAYKWGYDNEGSSPDPASETYRGPAAGSEPETKALDQLFRRVGFTFMVDYHSAAELLLYGVGWQVATHTPDDVVATALAGDDAHPAVPGYDPDLSAELYTTNGETDGHVADRYGTVGFTPEMSTCETASATDPDDQWDPADCVSGFVFPDDERLIQAEFAKNVPFALSVARSAADPADPVSTVGRTTPDFVTDPFEVSYGSPQPVATIARRSLRDVRLNYTINGGRRHTAKTSRWRGGQRYGGTNDEYFTELRGTVTGARPGDRVTAWFTGHKPGAGQVSSDAFTYRVNDDIGGDVLVLAAEDVTGISPVQDGTGAHYADEYVAALRAAGYSSDVYDIDAAGGVAPHPLGVLSHYRAVVWETGDDIIPRAPGQVAGTAARVAADTELAVRDYLNEGGRLLVSGQYALYAQAADGVYSYDPAAPPECTTPGIDPCLPLANDFVQYYLGAYTYVNDGGGAPDGTLYPVTGTAGPFDGFTGQLNAAGSAGNQRHTASLLTTSSFLPPEQFPQFTSSAPVGWQRPGAAPFDPYTGQWYLYSDRADTSYKRLSRTVDLTGAGAAELRLRASYQVETDWDYLFVEAHEVGSDDWTTLPDAGGHTGTGTGESCASGWVSGIHPFLAHYQGEDCSPTGSTGTWNAATGSSDGWQDWTVDLSRYAGHQVELSISYASDWGTQGIGVFLDDVRVLADGAPVADTSFEDDLGGWTVAGPPPGSPANTSDWTRSRSAFVEGSVVTTPATVYTGFGLEGLAPAQRADLVTRALRYLLPGRRH